MNLILDASALLALLHREPGAERVEQSPQDALVSAVNWAEVIQKSLGRRADISGLRTDFIEVGVAFEPFTAEQGEIAVGDHGCPVNSLSHRERAGVRGSNRIIRLISYPLILAFSRREKGFSLSTTTEYSCPATQSHCNRLFIHVFIRLQYNLTGQQRSVTGLISR